MDIATAKILVSAVLVFAVIVFSLVSFQAGFTHMIRDLKEGRKPRVGTESRQAE